jgi:hypothetical protein
MSKFICQFCKNDYQEYVEEGGNLEDEMGEYKGRPACWACLGADDDMFGGQHPDTEALEHYYPNEFLTEGDNQ